MALLSTRSVVWVRSESLIERSCSSGSPLLPGRPQHPSDELFAAVDPQENAVAVLSPPGPVKYTSQWELGEVEEVSGDSYTVRIGSSFPSGKSLVRRRVHNEDVFVANPARLDGIPDMARLSDLSQPCLLYNILVRYRCDAIYTFTGPLLISLNPFRRLDELYTPAVAAAYSGANLASTAPHVYSVAESARQGLIREGQSQSIVISGESGAGKTEACKHIMSFLASAVSGGGVEGKILQSNPITEALGNAKTARNNNSSRFGKFVRVAMARGGASILGAHIDHFLLEKPRITSQVNVNGTVKLSVAKHR